MFTLVQSTDIKGAGGETLPSPFKSLSRLEVEFRRGEFSLLAAGPGTGKSLIAANLALLGGMPVLYFSADSSAATQISRAAAIITGDDVKDVKAALLANDASAYEKELAARWWVRMNFSARPTPTEMELDLLAFLEVNGTSPHLICVDNITNVDYGNAGDAESYTFGLEALCDYLSQMARSTNAHVLGMHHVTGEHSNGTSPIPLSGVKGKTTRVPSLIMTAHAENDGMGGRIINMSPVKYREGFADPSGRTFASFRLNSRNLRFEELDGAEFDSII
ncbi:hypothetical protein SMD44_07388 [Streptomyces alboflavus]|uniref:SF4 helicase domain-containing protein n=1 Tax=Streptomyces alboflavus TaxID=67267 RepID=A0A1Z1WNB5_9ACTN|nr:AAA family ATPase [Streptomyces alboflavus]ARX87903.1 hypothetical protein SMD44_07388 [Streptomyces alboflavus]